MRCLCVMLQMLDKTRYTKITYVSDEHEKRLAVNSKLFKSYKNFDGGVSEICSAYGRIKLQVPNYIATHVLLSAKKCLLSFVYDFLLSYISIEKFAICLTDTDSVYCMFAGTSLEDSVDADKRQEFEHIRRDFCGIQRHPKSVLARNCCSNCELADNKTPLYWKCEQVSTKMISLTSKTYICVNENDTNKTTNTKMSCKGVNKRVVMANNPYRLYKSVMESQQSFGSTNTGFRNINDHMYTYKCQRLAFPFLYLKRAFVQGENIPVGVYTQGYIDLTLIQAPKHYFCIQTDAPVLDADYDKNAFRFEDYSVKTVRQALCLAKFDIVTDQGNPPKKKQKFTFNQETITAKKIMDTTDPYTLTAMMDKLGESDVFTQNEFSILYKIMGIKFDKHPQLLQHLIDSQSEYIVNACPFSARLGTGANHRVCRWQEGTYLCGTNLYGKVLMTYRSMLQCTIGY